MTTPTSEPRPLPYGGQEAVLAALQARRPGYTPEWNPAPGGDWSRARGPGAALARVAARFLEALEQRLGQAQGKRELAFLGLAGVTLVPPRPASAPVVFRLQDKARPVRVSAGTQVTAPPPPGSSRQVVFETEADVGVSPAKLVEVVSFWPGRDQYIDHSDDAMAGRPFQPFGMADLENTPHQLYFAHNTLLALAGKTTLLVGVELLTPGRPELDLVWEYWDGKVWRQFKDLSTGLANTGSNGRDGTIGLTRNGLIVLETDFAETALVAVHGETNYWVRARLDIPLPAGAIDIGQAGRDRVQLSPLVEAPRILPEIDVVELSVQIQRPLPAATGATTQATETPPPDDPLVGKPSPDRGLPVDKAFTDTLPIDLTKSFFPFGQLPSPGVTFYWLLDEVMTKPGAEVTIELSPANTPQHAHVTQLKAAKADIVKLPHLLAWEYWDGRVWSPLAIGPAPGFENRDDPRSLDPTGGAPAGSNSTTPSTGAATSAPPPEPTLTPYRLQFRVPSDSALTKVNNVDGRWARVRLVDGGFGVTHTVTAKAASGSTPAQTFVAIVSDPPALKDMRIGYVWQYGPYAPERVFTYNDFAYEDHTQDALWEGGTFSPFRPPGESTPALYLGFDQPPQEDSLGLFFDIAEDPDEDLGPALRWEYWDGFSWLELTAQDLTRALRVPGIVTVLGPSDSAELARFGRPRHWVRARLKDDGPPGSPLIRTVLPNAVGCVQRETVADEPIGLSDGLPNLALNFRRVPVMSGDWIQGREVGGPQVEVREVQGARAEVEWRLIARATAQVSEATIAELERQLAAEGTRPDPEAGGIRLRRDRLKRVVEVWVTWEKRPDLLSSGPDDRHYTVERSRGLIRFGDGVHGMVPPAGAAIQARRYQVGGGADGNVAVKAIQQFIGSIGGLESVSNPVPAQGGADGETIEQVRVRGPQAVRHRGRAIMPADYEALAREASPSVARAWAVGGHEGSGRTSARPGGVTVHILPSSAEPKPWPSFGLREQVRLYLAERAPAGVSWGDCIKVTGPRFQEIDVEATIAPRRISEAGAVLDAVQKALMKFLHPVDGGSRGEGWAPGRNVYPSDVAAVLESVPGVDHVESLILLVNAVPQDAEAVVGPGYVAAAGVIRLRLAAPAPGATGGRS